MHTVTLKAHYDGKKICLDEPFDLKPDARLMVTVMPDSEEGLKAEREAWYALGQASLARAYGENEPDYSDCVGKLPPKE